MTSFSSMEEAREYADAYSEEVGRYPKKKQKEYWGDPEWYLNYKRKWEEKPNGMTGDPFMNPGIQNNTRWWS